MKFAIYSRKSKFTGKGESIDNQIELCRQHITALFGEKHEIITFEDEGFSGGNLDRPQFQQMMKRVREKEFSHIVCYRLDRISRNIGDFAVLIEELSDLECGFISIKEQFDTSSPMGRAMMYIASVFSQLERETIAERIRDNMHELAKTGRWLGGTTPTGYVSVPLEKVSIDGKTHKSFKLEVVEEESRVVNLIYNKFIEENSLSKVETFLLQNSIKSKTGAEYTRFSIRNILTNPVYMRADAKSYQYFTNLGNDIFAEKDLFDSKHGMMIYNKTSQKKGKTHETRPIEEWIISVGKHEGLIDADIWIQVQGMLEVNKSKSYRKTRSNVALLSGLIKCEKCGSFIRPKTTTRRNKQGEIVYDYLCSLKERSKGTVCNIKNSRGNDVDKLVCDELVKLASDSSTFFADLEKAKKELLSDTTSIDTEISRLKNIVSKLESEIVNLSTGMAMNEDDGVKQIIQKTITEKKLELDKANVNIQELQELTKEHVFSSMETDILTDVLKNFAENFSTMPIVQRRLALRTFVREVYWDGENIHIYLHNSKPHNNIPQGVYCE